MADGPCKRCGGNDFYVRPKSGFRDCNVCRRVEAARQKKLRKEREAKQIPIPQFQAEGVGPERTAELKAMFDSMSNGEWDAVLDSMIAAASDDPDVSGE